MSPTDIENILNSLGYNLFDRGDYWQCSAVYRNGDNQTALQIYKDSGVWKDYVSGTDFLPFKALVEKSVSDENSAKQILKNLNLNPSSALQTPLSTPNSDVSNFSEKLFSRQEVDDLLPHYSFYEGKGISRDTLKFFQSGMSTSGAMYQRFVFPILNKNLKIHGLAGRNMNQYSDRPKWKHMGRKTKWVYPLHIPDSDGNFPILNNILKNKEVILVESIGDMLSLYEHDVKNVLVTFGVDVSPALISSLIGLNINNVVLSLNNDFDKSKNVGMESSIKMFLKLLSYFDYSKVNICLPNKNDFGDMSSVDIENWKNKKINNIKNNDKICERVVSHAKDLFKKNKISKNIYTNIRKVPCFE